MLMNMPSLEKLAHEIGAILDKPLPRPGQKITVSSAMTFFQGKRNETFPERFTIVS